MGAKLNSLDVEGKNKSSLLLSKEGMAEVRSLFAKQGFM